MRASEKRNIWYQQRERRKPSFFLSIFLSSSSPSFLLQQAKEEGSGLLEKEEENRNDANFRARARFTLEVVVGGDRQKKGEKENENGEKIYSLDIAGVLKPKISNDYFYLIRNRRR